jgi:hypothetical protein
VFCRLFGDLNVFSYPVFLYPTKFKTILRILPESTKLELGLPVEELARACACLDAALK